MYGALRIVDVKLFSIHYLKMLQDISMANFMTIRVDI